MDALQDADVTVHIEETPHPSPLLGGYYEDCLLKLLAFKMHKLDPSLKRVLLLDSDQLILKHFDNLFSDLPTVDLAAPRAYWLSQEQAAFSSAFMLITLSDRLWGVVNKTIPIDGSDAKDPVRADMDILNDELGGTAMILSGEYVTLNSHWEDWKTPNWFHAEDFPHLNRTISDVVPNIPDLVDGATIEPRPDLRAGDEGQVHMARLEPDPRYPEDSDISQQLVQLYEYTSIVHFSALGKPWSYSTREVMDMRQEAHPLFALQFGMWRKVAREVCPEDWSVK
ncbi:Glucose N-acetyltransferase 1 [Cytospora mali]|uniref:Glucose N-acetyltransferase 1 n=1 Tax=Cytospora mali TaxID=578113 RepID=A0A194UXP5_CYTMA|nr:Glucose N-acetyltransferase 1 [Valsa mali var. pyri (nom. inval.)]